MVIWARIVKVQVNQQKCQPAGKPEDGDALGGSEQAQEFAATENYGQADLDQEQGIGGELFGLGHGGFAGWAPPSKVTLV